VKFLREILSEAEGGKAAKPSFGRFFGGIVILVIVVLAVMGRQVPDSLLNLFWTLIGYQALTKGLSTASPAVLEYSKSFVVKAQSDEK